ncbi:hypothetical protein [Gulosibacter sp. ACHW.36C]|uniref:Uncharacterized protein n=1 Tax=Gulosibacter sediminis TaxID=1729695 RepID=A0ABY4MZ97_9MICO|nr:hypothetical protein [Gulosibacter sediminis]UQN15767.1 hypothetical protein M3M28_04775 [Gulosibacter sediminis]
MTAPRWQQLLERPENIDATGIAIAIIADGGDTAYRRALARWNSLRERNDKDAQAGIALILADAFDDHRAIDEIAETWPEVFPEQFAWRTVIAEPGARTRRAFGAKSLAALRAWGEDGTAADLPADAAQAARMLHPDDAEEVYLPLRRLLLERAHEEVVRRNSAASAAVAADDGDDKDNADDESTKAAEDAEQPAEPTATDDLTQLEAAMAASDLVDTAERAADNLLVAAARATPDSYDVQRVVLSYWGEAEPLDAVPTANPRPGDPPASWTATCEVLAGTRSPRVAEKFNELAESYDELHGRELEEYVDALERAHASFADAKLLELAKSDSAAASLAVRALADRRRRLVKAQPPMTERFDAIVEALHEHGILTELPGVQARAALAKQRTADEEPLQAALAIADAYGRPTGNGLVLEWASFASWLETATLPGPAPVPAVTASPRQRPGGIRGLFRRNS